MLHPAAALRNPELRWDMETDIKRLPEIVAEVKRRRAGELSAPPTLEAVEADPPDDDDAPPVQLSLF
jgi:hypothetical protein